METLERLVPRNCPPKITMAIALILDVRDDLKRDVRIDTETIEEEIEEGMRIDTAEEEVEGVMIDTAEEKDDEDIDQDLDLAKGVALTAVRDMEIAEVEDIDDVNNPY